MSSVHALESIPVASHASKVRQSEVTPIASPRPLNYMAIEFGGAGRMVITDRLVESKTRIWANYIVGVIFG